MNSDNLVPVDEFSPHLNLAYPTPINEFGLRVNSAHVAAINEFGPPTLWPGQRGHGGPWRILPVAPCANGCGCGCSPPVNRASPTTGGAALRSVSGRPPGACSADDSAPLPRWRLSPSSNLLTTPPNPLSLSVSRSTQSWSVGHFLSAFNLVYAICLVLYSQERNFTELDLHC